MSVLFIQHFNRERQCRGSEAVFEDIGRQSEDWGLQRFEDIGRQSEDWGLQR